ncbi:ROK family transcriptional regulator [Grimontia hollisae]|uniref:ROK family protein n=1 Tax=Grimontia hollisae CIP 101886 TaxID=675812 RepID=D0I2W9_GRIHO|nr:ROK family protein [Grimontia hollisae]AMG30619.1 ROK family transcriptional regulator [Grimontia hollisae]EEY74169.1 ROK family protein [Grimontia hollisae CIP 101886]MDF2183592.1 ROK family protein [Grimontia hollisae]STO47762.1 Beta-glucoside kinase [Grimontia hollisae]
MHYFSKSEAVVLNLLIEKESLSKAGVASQSNLSKPTVSKVIDSLCARKVLLEQKKGSRMLYSINGGFDNVLSVEINATLIRFAVFDFTLTLKYSTQFNKYTTKVREAFFNTLCDDIKAFVKQAGINSQTMLVSVATAGVVDSLSGQIIQGTANFPEWQDFNLVTEMSSRLSCPVIVENNVRSYLIGECSLHRFSDNNNVVVICLDAGVGSAMLCSGKVLRGSTNRAGEIGFMMTSRESLSKPWAVRGALEEHCSLSGMKSRYEIMTGKELSTGKIFDLIEQDDLQADLLFSEFIDYLCIAIINIVSVTNPERIILYGETCKYHSFFLDKIRKILQLQKISVDIDISTQPGVMATLGAAILGYKVKYPSLNHVNIEI